MKLDGGEATIEVADDTVEEVLTLCELKIARLMSISFDAFELANLDLVATEEMMMAKCQSNVRIPGDMHDDESEGDDGTSM